MEKFNHKIDKKRMDQIDTKGTIRDAANQFVFLYVMHKDGRAQKQTGCADTIQ